MKKITKLGIGLVGGLVAFFLMLIIGSIVASFLLEIIWPGRPKGPKALIQIGPIWTTDPYALLTGFLLGLYSGWHTFRRIAGYAKKKRVDPSQDSEQS